MRTYTPRRAGKRWLEGAPHYVYDVFDNKGETADRYTVILGGPFMMIWPGGSPSPGNTWMSVLTMSEAPTHPLGVSMLGEYSAATIADYRYRQVRYRIRWMDLPAPIREHVIARCEEED
jgi:hypothetical protein